MKRIALYPGTFDPVTNGHIDIMYRASSLCDTLIVGVAENIGKNPFFSVSERKSLIEGAIKNKSKAPNRHLGEIVIKSFDNLLIDFARSNSVTMIIRGLRAVSDFDYEFQMAGMNRSLYSNAETIFLRPAEHLSFISSTLVREISLLGGDVSNFVEKSVLDALDKKITEKNSG